MKPACLAFLLATQRALPVALAAHEPLPPWPVGKDGDFYFCHRAFPGPGGQGELYYYTRALPLHPPQQHLDDAVGKAFVRHVLNLDPHIRRQPVLDEEFNWPQACATSWPYGVASFNGPRDQYASVGGKEIDWEYSPDKDLTVKPAP